MEKLLTEENQVVTIVIIGVLLLLLMGIALLLFFFFSRKKIIEKELERKELEIDHQKEMIRASIVTQEKERKRIAQDLHDDISSKLNVIHLHANLLSDGDLTRKEYQEVNQNIINVTDKTLESARKIAHNLLPPILEKFGLQPALEELADDFNNSRKININYSINYPQNHLAKQNELHVFRIVQELINNSVRHGKSKKSSLKISCIETQLHIVYKDNGVGFNIDEITRKKGLGMKNIESRVELLQGKLTVKSKENKGIHVSIII